MPNLNIYIQNHQSAMPRISGLKGHAISGLLRDMPENDFGKANAHGCEENTAYNGMPEIGIDRPSELIQDELMPNYFVPNFVRPIPEIDDDPEDDDPNGGMYDISEDGVYLVPGMLPEPYWDFNMVSDQYNYAQMKKYLSRACKMPLKPQEAHQLKRGLQADKEMVFHIDMCPAKLPDLVIHNPTIA
jgi:hypothetical protein